MNTTTTQPQLLPHLRIPQPVNYLSSYMSAPTEWTKLRLSAFQTPHRTPPPSPCPSLSSSSRSAPTHFAPAHNPDSEMLEIEELSDAESTGELLHGEFEEAPPENHAEPQIYDEEDIEIVDAESHHLPPLFSWQHPMGMKMLGKKRSFRQDEDEEHTDVDYATDSSLGSWRSARRRKVGRGQAVEVARSDRSTPDFMMDMEL